MCSKDIVEARLTSLELRLVAAEKKIYHPHLVRQAVKDGLALARDMRFKAKTRLAAGFVKVGHKISPEMQA